MATPSVRADNLKLLYLGIREVFEGNLRSLRKPAYAAMTHQKISDKYEEYYDTVGNLPSATEKAEGGSISYGQMKGAFRSVLRNKTVANGVVISMELMEDDLYKITNAFKGSELARTMMAKRERDFAYYFNKADSIAGADGMFLASHTHPLLSHETLSNNNLASGPITPDSLVAAKNLFNGIVTQSGEPMDTSATLLVAHPNKMAAVMAVLESELKAMELTNTKNTVNEYMPVRAAFNRYIDTEKYPWALIDTTMEDAGFIFQRRKGLTTDYWYDIKDTLNFYFNVHERYCFGVISPGYGFVWSAGESEEE